MQKTHVGTIGAGPYRLIAAAHLHADGVVLRVFGTVMEFWRNMPKGMFFRSEWDRSRHLGPANADTLNEDEHIVVRGRDGGRPRTVGPERWNGA